MLRNLAISLINARDERIVTTLPKAKELRPFVERAITLSRKAQDLDRDDPRVLHLRRQAAGFFHAGNTQQTALTGRRGQLRLPRTAGVAALKRLFAELGKRYEDRPGGYTRILKLGRREGDNAELAIIELVDNPRELEAQEAAKKRKAASSKKKRSAESRRRGTKPAEKAEARGSAAEVETQNETEEATEPEASAEDKGS
jgi:large subunit ribosomal protein L17